MSVPAYIAGNRGGGLRMPRMDLTIGRSALERAGLGIRPAESSFGLTGWGFSSAGRL